MRALSIRQPWANQIIYTGKDVENRSQHTNMRGWVAIHASLTMADDFGPHYTRKNPTSLTKAEFVEQCDAAKRYLPENCARNIVRGAIIGMANLTDSLDSHQSPHWDGESIAWVLQSALPLTRPIFCSGQLGFWTVLKADERKIRRQLKDNLDFSGLM